MEKKLEKIIGIAEKFNPVSKLLPSPFRLSLIIYALIVLYRVNGNKVQIFESIGVAIFPAFFIAYIATIGPHYLNLLEPIEDITDDAPELGFFEELRQLKNHQIGTLFIFIPIYLLITYKLNKKLLHKVMNMISPH